MTKYLLSLIITTAMLSPAQAHNVHSVKSVAASVGSKVVSIAKKTVALAKEGEHKVVAVSAKAAHASAGIAKEALHQVVVDLTATAILAEIAVLEIRYMLPVL